MTEPQWWPADYFASRARFLQLAKACGARTESHPINAVGPGGEPLSVDVAFLTTPHDEHVIVLASGVHGVEGFIGASVQTQALRKLAHGYIPDRVGIVMIHAVNPWGFAHLRRVDENNVDVNRNFIHSSTASPVSHKQYATLDPIINSRKAPGPGGEIHYWLSTARLIAQNKGIRKLFKPIAEGQYDFPQGLFFGGSQAGECCALLQNLILDLSASVEQVTVLDLHSGLGPSGTATLIGSSNRVPLERQSSWLHAHYDQPVVIDNASGNVYNAQGSFSQWCRQALGDKSFLYLCVEIGTVNPIRLFSAMRRENQAHHWTGLHSASYVRTKQALLEVFAPDSRRWRLESTRQGLKVFERTFDLSSVHDAKGS